MTRSEGGSGGGASGGSGGGSSSGSEAWERLSSLYETARALPAAERAHYVNDVCSDNPDMHRELVALLAAGEGAEDFLNDLAADVVAPLLENVVSSPESLESQRDARLAIDEAAAMLTLPAGSAIAHFEILGELGRGGMGVVYRARDQRLNRAVAIKVVSPEAFADADARQRLMEEARAVSALDDPNVCSLYAIEDTSDGGLCMIMALCANGTLRERLKAGLLPVATALTVARQLARGLAAAHRQGIVHRDLKPANVGFADQDVVKLLDFGVAVRPADSSGTRSVGGTLAYMAPELLQHGEATARSDVWSLGVVLFEMLTGQRPFTGDSRAAVRRAIAEGVVPPMIRADKQPIPQPVHALVHRLLQREPATRPANAAEVLRLLDAQRPRSRSVPPRLFAIAATLAVVATGWALTQRGTRESANATASPPLELVRSNEAPQPVAVMPFVVRGNASLSYLREGMVDLLTPALDATGLLRGIDPQAVLAAVPAPDSAAGATGATGTEQFGDVVRALGAQRYVTGSIVQVGEALTLRATLRDVGGEESARATVTLASAAELLAGVDDLVRQLVALELRAPGDTIGGIAAATTTSVPALRAFLDGERELRDARPLAAIVQFSQAVARDSTFALAWYRLARAARWGAVDSLNQVATDRAFALAASLPYRWQTIVRAYHEMQRGSVLAATRTFRELADMYPSDVEVALLLGEALFHDNPYHGRPSSEAEASFRRVMSLDPKNRELTVYLMDLAARANATGALDTLFTMYFDPNSAGEEPGVRQTYLALHARRVRGDAAAGAVRLSDPLTAQTALHRITADERDLAAARAFARAMTGATAPISVRVEGWLALATLTATTGQWTVAAEHWREAAAFDARGAARHRAMTLLAWPLSASQGALREAQRALRDDLAGAVGAVGQDAVAADAVARNATANRTTANNTAGNNAAMALTQAEETLVNWYLMGVLGARLQDSSAINEAVRAITATATSPRLSAPLRSALEARQWIARGDTTRALVAFANSEVDVPVFLRRRYPLLEQHADRFDRAELHFARGEYEAASAWYRSVIDGFALWGLPYRGRVTPQLRALSLASTTNE